ncbi:MAG: hypothetical protein CYPHOPRED_001948 [Cyphobasidiales sp. Tagirdzhanova-0007]|nr:MAG: hypothetical protein CYPHOPRED_001948 [Cyphobasidiales sp. Tagirdzhanova-0007]
MRIHNSLNRLSVQAALALAVFLPAVHGGCSLLSEELCAVQSAMSGSLITPQVIPVFEPEGYLHIFYDNIDVGPAQQLAPERVAQRPFVKFNSSAKDSMGPPYVLLAIDPDASAIHTSQSCALHWMITDVYFDPKTGLMSSGFVSAQYSRPNPPEGPLHHRYVFLLYQQPVLFLPPVFPSTLTGSRLHFSLPLFTLDYGMYSPVAGNFLKSYWTGVPVAEQDLIQFQKPPITIKAHASPVLAAVIGSAMGFMYSMSS